MGPFLWEVWLALTATYLLAIFPIAFSVWHTLRPLLDDISELENMFWYVFGTFTNCFTFSGANSWSRSKTVATRVFIGQYFVYILFYIKIGRQPTCASLIYSYYTTQICNITLYSCSPTSYHILYTHNQNVKMVSQSYIRVKEPQSALVRR
jgi:hypothetical protein